MEDLKGEILEGHYLKKSSNIYVRNYRKVKKVERGKIKCQEAFLCFLEKNLSLVNYEKAFRYVNDLSQKSNDITSIWNHIFYFAGLENKEKLFSDKS